jgi:hypothetical protein
MLHRIILKTSDLELKIEKEGREIMNQLKLDNTQRLKKKSRIEEAKGTEKKNGE